MYYIVRECEHRKFTGTLEYLHGRGNAMARKTERGYLTITTKTQINLHTITYNLRNLTFTYPKSISYIVDYFQIKF